MADLQDLAVQFMEVTGAEHSEAVTLLEVIVHWHLFTPSFEGCGHHPDHHQQSPARLQTTTSTTPLPCSLPKTMDRAGHHPVTWTPSQGAFCVLAQQPIHGTTQPRRRGGGPRAAARPHRASHVPRPHLPPSPDSPPAAVKPLPGLSRRSQQRRRRSACIGLLPIIFFIAFHGLSGPG